jgi:hypothetical protein
MKRFHYYDKKKKRVYRADPQFVEDKVLMQTEKRYQEYMSQYVQVEKRANEVVVFDARLYGEKSRLILVDLDTLEERECEYFEPNKNIEKHFKKRKPSLKYMEGVM